MKTFLHTSLFTLITLIALTGMCFPDCNNPSSPGVVICNPTPGSTVVFNPRISIRSTPAAGATITRFKVYDNNVQVFEGAQGQTGGDIDQTPIYNGNHYLVVNAWDTAGHLYQAKETFVVVGQGYLPCPPPKSPGINFCVPVKGDIYSPIVPFSVTAKGQSAITNISSYLNGQPAVSRVNSSVLSSSVLVSPQGVPSTLTITATDSKGNKYTQSKVVSSTFTYDFYVCTFYSCPPGIDVVAPVREAYVGKTFTIDMHIVGNPNPITAMKAYIDNKVVATSSGGTMQQEITNAPNGTHILTVQGWDNKGIEYRIQENININISN